MRSLLSLLTGLAAAASLSATAAVAQSVNADASRDPVSRDGRRCGAERRRAEPSGSHKAIRRLAPHRPYDQRGGARRRGRRVARYGYLSSGDLGVPTGPPRSRKG
jgi:hypothetical protein